MIGKIPLGFSIRIRSILLTSIDIARGKELEFESLSSEYFSGTSDEWKMLMSAISGRDPIKRLPEYVCHDVAGREYDAPGTRSPHPDVVIRQLAISNFWPMASNSGIDYQVARAFKKLDQDKDLSGVSIWYISIEKQESWDLEELWESLSPRERKALRAMVAKDEEPNDDKPVGKREVRSRNHDGEVRDQPGKGKVPEGDENPDPGSDDPQGRNGGSLGISEG